MKKNKILTISKDYFLILCILFIMFLYVFPFLWVFLTSTKPDGEIFTDTMNIFSSKVSFEKYSKLFNSSFLVYIRNSIIVCFISTFITVLISILAAYGFSRYTFKGKDLLTGTFVFSQMFPFVVLLTPLYLLFWKFHLINTFTGLIISYIAITLPFCVYMLLGYFRSVPISLDEAASIDGSSTIRTLFQIILPVTWPGIVATAVFSFVRSWNEYLFALTLMNDDIKKTIPVGLANFFGQYTTEWGSVMSASVVATIPTLIFFIIMQKQLVSGLAAGAVKQ